ncbi:S-type pyocin [Pseudomonas baetica]|uniref:S-type pyocin n=1 Tax=Pseudomonas baetica TaxID=674054 RepID=A0ABX4PY85_9PSED|nr:S-type pyocin domain-containing protein [Pseudomonas baetica]PKA69240.1 S-type pyocin [Pseudomonas baetica]PTC20945.1 colicin transporter [Pseudomonas baetica]
MQRPPPLILDATHINAPAPDHYDPFKESNQGYSYSGMFGPAGATHKTRELMYETQVALEQEFSAKSILLPQSIENELAATRLERSTSPLPPAAAIVRELDVRNTLIQHKSAQLHEQITIANRFFGSDPLGKNFNDFLNQASAIRRTNRAGPPVRELWSQSYRAAHEARLLNQTVQLLNQQQINVQNWLSAVLANDQAQAAAAAQEAQRLAAERARIAAEQQRQRELAEAARREQEQVRAREQARLAALAEKQRRDAEQARLAAEVARINADAEARERERIAQLRIALAEAQANAETAARVFAAEQARLQAEMELRIEAIQKQVQADKKSMELRHKVLDTATALAKRQAHLATLENQQQLGNEPGLHDIEPDFTTEADAQNLGHHSPEIQRVYAASGVVASTSPHFSFASTAIRLPPATSSAILNALRSGLLTVKASGAALFGSPVLIGFAALLMPSRLGNGERFAISVPFSELSSESAQTLRDIADRQGTLEMPVGLGVRPLGAGAEVFVASTDDFHIRSSVLVLNAAYDLLNDVYEAALPDSPTDFLTWTPAISPGNSSTESPMVETESTAYSGAPIVPVEGRLDLHPILVEGWERFIIVFPDDSGIAPLYVVFSSPYAGGYVKGKYSGRIYNPELSGGPILDLDWRTAAITKAGINAVKLHVARFNQSDANDIMIQGLERILNENLNPTDTDLRYYTHELRELERYRNFGYSDDSSPSDESPIWNNAHTATLEDYKLGSELTLLYNEEAINAMNAQDEREYQNDLRSFGQ